MGSLAIVAAAAIALLVPAGANGQGAGTAALTSTAGQAVVTVNEDVNFRFGVLGQFQAEWLEDGPTGDAPNLFARRVRLLFGGQVARNVTFFVETDAPNLGKKIADGKNIAPAMVIEDAYGEIRVRSWLLVDAGLILVPFSRNSVQSAASLMAIDYGPYSFAQSAPTQSKTGRDTGVQARGYLLGNRLEYRVAALQGAHRPDLDPSARYMGRLQYQLLEPEGTGFFYTGTYLGTKRVAAVGGAIDVQDDYRAYDLDAFVDHPLGGGALTAMAAYNHFDGGTTLPTLPEQDALLLEVGYLLPRSRLMPVLQAARRSGTTATFTDESRWSLGVNYWLARHNASVKAAYGQIRPAGADARNQFTVQLQVFYF